jgi:hypothetical protein
MYPFLSGKAGVDAKVPEEAILGGNVVPSL